MLHAACRGKPHGPAQPSFASYPIQSHLEGLVRLATLQAQDRILHREVLNLERPRPYTWLVLGCLRFAPGRPRTRPVRFTGGLAGHVQTQTCNSRLSDSDLAPEDRDQLNFGAQPGEFQESSVGPARWIAYPQA